MKTSKLLWVFLVITICIFLFLGTMMVLDKSSAIHYFVGGLFFAWILVQVFRNNNFIPVQEFGYTICLMGLLTKNLTELIVVAVLGLAISCLKYYDITRKLGKFHSTISNIFLGIQVPFLFLLFIDWKDLFDVEGILALDLILAIIIICSSLRLLIHLLILCDVREN